MQVSETRQKMNRVQQFKMYLDNTQTLDDVYNLLNQLSSDVLDMYPHISCRTQCNSCCKGTSMPAITPAEWAKVHDYLWRYYTPEQREALVTRTREMYNPRKALYWGVHDTIQQPANMEKLKSFKEVLTQLTDTQCPMLVNETCSIYMSRPAKCRAHGGFLYVFGEYTQMHACESEVDKMEIRLKEQGSRSVLMPVWNDFEQRIVDKFNDPGATSTILPIWLLTHLHKGELIEDPNPEPDFEAFREQDM